MIDTPDALSDFDTKLLKLRWLSLTQSWPINVTLMREFFAHVHSLPKEKHTTISQFVLRGLRFLSMHKNSIHY